MANDPEHIGFPEHGPTFDDIARKLEQRFGNGLASRFVEQWQDIVEQGELELLDATLAHLAQDEETDLTDDEENQLMIALGLAETADYGGPEWLAERGKEEYLTDKEREKLSDSTD